MTDYYFDIETSDRDPWRDQVIAIAFQPLRWNRPDGELAILEAWKQGGEKGMLLDIQRRGLFDVEGLEAFDFIPVGTNLLFDLTFLIVRMRELGIRDWTTDEVLHFFHGKPRKDIKTALVAMNDGKFAGAGLDTFTSKKRSTGAVVPEMWRKKDFRALEQYVQEDAAAFLEVYGRIAEVLGSLGLDMRRRP
jgi:hypothetical protein